MQATARRLSVVSAMSCARRRLIRDVRLEKRVQSLRKIVVAHTTLFLNTPRAVNSPARIPSARTILTLLVLAPIVSLAVQQFWQGLTVGLLDPLGHLLFGSSAPEIRLGPFNLSPVLSGIVGSFLTIIVGTFSTILALRLSWRIIARALPDDDHRND